MEKKSASALTCPECGGEFAASDLLDGDSIVTCLNCNKKFRTSEILRKSSEVETEEIRSSAYRDVEHERTKAYREAEQERTRAYREVEHDRTEAFREAERARQKVEKERLKFEYKKVKDRKSKERSAVTRKVLKIVLPIASGIAILGVLLFLIIGLALRGYNTDPNAIRAGISSEDLEGMNYYEVAELLQEKGFTNITLHNEGWHLLKEKGEVKSVTIDGCDEFYGFSKFLPDDLIIIYYYKGSDSDTIPTAPSQEKEESMSEISWPKSDIASIVPVPNSTIGRIEWETYYGFVIYIGNTSLEQYKDYVDLCWESGFNIEYSRGDDYFWADNEDGHCLTVRHQEGNIMFIRIDAKGYGFNK